MNSIEIELSGLDVRRLDLPVIWVDKSLLPRGFPIMGELESSSKSGVIQCYIVPPANCVAEECEKKQFLSHALFSILSVEERNAIIHLPETYFPEVSGDWDPPLPEPFEIDLENSQIPGLREGNWIQVATEKSFAILRVRKLLNSCEKTDMNTSLKLYMPYVLRVVLEIEPGQTVQISQIPKGYNDKRSIFLKAVEKLFSFILKRPNIVLLGTEAVAGDDHESVVRIDAGLFPVIGISAGDQVTIKSGPRSIDAVVASPSVNMQNRMKNQFKKTGQQVAYELFSGGNDVPPYLMAWIPAPLRRQLLLDRNSLIVIERKLLPLIRKRSRDIVIPAVGILLAALTIDFPGSWIFELLIILGAAIVSALLIILPIRLPKVKE